MNITIRNDISAPQIIISSPQNITYSTTSIHLNVSANEAVNTWMYSINGTSNVTFQPNITLTFADGSYNIRVWANDTAGNIGFQTVYFTVNLTLDITNLSLIYTNATQRIFKFPILNKGNSTLSNINWTLSTGQNTISSLYSTTLQPNEDIIVYVYHNYTSSGTYNLTATAFNQNFTDSEKIQITV